MSDMQNTTDRAARLIDSITSAIMTTVEVAAEKIELASQVAAARQRAEALAVVLEGTAAHRMALEERLATATGPIRAMLSYQIAAVQAQEVAILTRAGVPLEAAQSVFLPAPGPVEPQDEVTIDKPTHRRDGRRFARVPTNGTHGN